MNKPKLERCPFCGGEATLKWLSGTGWMIRCSKCSGRVMDNEGEYAGVQAWNRRTPPDNKALTVEELRETQNEAFDLGYQTCLHDRCGLTWDAAAEEAVIRPPEKGE